MCVKKIFFLKVIFARHVTHMTLRVQHEKYNTMNKKIGQNEVNTDSLTKE